MVVQALALEGLNVAIGALTTSLNVAVDLSKQFIGQADKTQKSSLALGTSFENISKGLGGSLDNLRGSLDTRLASVFAGLEAGLQGNSIGLGKLINQQKLTNTSTRNTATMFAKLENRLGISREAQDKLGNKIVELNQTWGISTDKLVNAIDSLSESMPYQEIAGWGEDFTIAVASLQAKLGPELDKELNTFLKTLTSTGDDAYAKLVLMNIGDIRERISKSKDANEKLSLLTEGIKRAGTSFSELASGGSDFYRGMGVATEALGRAGEAANVLAKNLDSRTMQEGVDYGKQLSVLFSEISEPFERLVKFQLYPVLLSLSEVFTQVANAIVGKLSEGIETRLPQIIESLVSAVGISIKLLIEFGKFLKYSFIRFSMLWDSMKPLIFFLGLLADITSIVNTGMFYLFMAIEKVYNFVKSWLGFEEIKEKQDPAVALLDDIADILTDIDITLQKTEKNTRTTAETVEDGKRLVNPFLDTTSGEISEVFDRFIRGQESSDKQDEIVKELQILNQKVEDAQAAGTGTSLTGNQNQPK